MSSKALLVSFHTLSPNLFASLEPALNQQLPLTQLTWHSLGARRQTRVIPQIQLTFTPLDHASTSQEVLPSPTTSNAANMLERPFVHMCFFSCDDPEVYRNTARPQLRAWLDRVQSGAAGSHKSEWLIVLVTPSSQLSKGKFYQRKSTVIDKLKSDFNSSSSSSGARGKDRVVALAVNPPSDDSNAPVTSNPEVWSDLITRLKESLINALEANVQSTEEDLRRLDAQRTVPGWNYCVFFERKEALAFAFESMGLIQDAIVVYDELEAGFEQSLKEHNIVFTAVGGQSPGDDALSLFSTTQKPYKNLIQSNNISIFDFKYYLSARQFHLLRSIGKLEEVLTRGQAVIRALSWAMRQEQGESDLLCSWIYNTCVELSDVAQKANKAAMRAELLNLARRSIERLAISKNLLPDEHPFASSQSELLSAASRNQVPIQATLAEALQSDDTFSELYGSLLLKTKDAFAEAGRGRMAVVLGHVLAAFYRIRKDTTQAAALFATSTYGPARWRTLEGYILSQSLGCLRDNKCSSRDELLTSLAALRAGTRDAAKGWLVSPLVATDQAAYASRLLSRVKTRAEELEKDLAAIGFPAFGFVAFTEEPWRDDEGAVIVPYKVFNHLPSDVEVDELRLKLTTPQGDLFWFLSSSTTLLQGENLVEAKCLADVQGPVVLDTFQIRLSHILFQYSHRVIIDRNSTWNPYALAGSGCHLVTIPQDPLAFSVHFETPHSSKLGKTRQAVLVLGTGRHDVQQAQVFVIDPSQRADFHWKEAVSETEFEDISKGIKLGHLSPHQQVRITLPYSGAMMQANAEMRITVQWHNTSSPNLSRMLQIHRRLPAGLPFSVNAKDLFRSSKIISHFTVEASKFQSLRIQKALLKSEMGSKIIPARKEDSPSVLIQAGHEGASFLFILEPDSNDEPGSMTFELLYRTLVEEQEFLLLRATERALSQHNLSNLGGLAQRLATLWTSYLSPADLYEPTNPTALINVLHTVLSPSTLKRAFGKQSPWAQLHACLQDAATSTNLQDLEDVPWRSAVMQTDAPSVQILASATLALPAEHRIEVGQPIRAFLTISLSFSWAVEAKDHLAKNGQRMTFLLKAEPLDWVINGQYSGEFLGRDGTSMQVCLQLIPLRAGSLQIPKLVIRPLPPQSPPTEKFEQLPYLPTCELHHTNAGQRVEVVALSTEAAFWVPLE